MRQTLTLLGVLQRMAIRNTTPYAAPESARFEAIVLLELDQPEPTTASSSLRASVFDAQRPEHAAVHQARPGDRVEVVGHWHGLDSYDDSGNLVTVQVFWIERFRVVGG